MRSRLTLLLLLLLPAFAASAQVVPNPDPVRFKAEIDAFTAWDRKNTPPKDAILFVGSSSIRLWDTAEAFAGMTVINRGFGGAHISDMLAYFDQTVAPYAPRAIVFYCGGNDIADGKSPEQVAIDFGRFLAGVRYAFGEIPVIYIPAKPSIARWSLHESMERLNEAVTQMGTIDQALAIADIWTPMVATGTPPSESLFVEDGLHLSAEGYAIWLRVVGNTLKLVLD